jgi:hypothetical protein
MLGKSGVVVLESWIFYLLHANCSQARKNHGTDIEGSSS